MKKESYELFKSATVDEIISHLAKELQTKNESAFWATRVVPFSEAILSVLVVLRDEKKLFNPEGVMVDELTPELFFRWSDFVSLKSLAFKIQRTNRATDESKTEIDLSKLASYLSANGVNLENEQLDFPIPTYNLHQGVSNVIKSLL
ncbi:MAG: hypothetical protein PHI38_10030 [Sulfurimonas sp.]|jgi:hypothetical protein|uniref:hypothetical protein n=1 Tax=Sulfurimonas sp. TaxID=2022749 RepID=UPI0026281FBA|nr:hypothetical protein [Sulfurimonas sp.]MDD3477195.1 hypothetical protein [Sulfurimonas sp.]